MFTLASTSHRRATANDVAQLLGISRSVVSRAFTPGAPIAEQTKRKILQAAAQLGYAPNAIARMLIKRENNLVGVVMGNPANAFLSHLLTALLDALQEAGYFPLLFRVTDREEFNTVLPKVLQYQVAAVFVTGRTPNPQIAAQCMASGIPLCVLNRWVTGDYPGHVVSCDHELGGRIAAEQLVAAGYRRIALVTSISHMSTHQARVRGFTRRLEELGQTLHGFEDGQFDHQSGFNAAIRLLSSSVRPDSMFCTGDVLAFGAIDASRKMGISIPQEVGILGFDDVHMASWPGYQLSTIHQPTQALVAQAVPIAMGTFQSDSPVRILVPPHFVQRQTMSITGVQT